MSISSRGKHLLVGFDGGLTLHTHLGMDGWWRFERLPGRPLARRGPPGRGMQVRLATATISAVLGDAPVVELLDASGLRRHPVLRALGPDLCDERPDLDETLRRLELIDQTTPVGLVLLDQRPRAGSGTSTAPRSCGRREWHREYSSAGSAPRTGDVCTGPPTDRCERTWIGSLVGPHRRGSPSIGAPDGRASDAGRSSVPSGSVSTHGPCGGVRRASPSPDPGP